MKRVSRPAWMLGATVLLIVLGPGLVQQVRLAWAQHCLEQRLRALNADQAELTKRHQRLTSDSVYVEGLMRSTFKVAKPDELVVPLGAQETSGRTPRDLGRDMHRVAPR